ncbi:MAG: polysaccharide deacetylase family protein [Clostridiales bacterium]|nr:polysaccharide deacetylase family protein [Candidatus Scatonaster coprocaballi]
MKEAYLTIDDGPSVDRIKKVEILKKYGIQAVWFSMGIDMEANADAAIRTILAGQVIGNHSYTHPNFSEISIAQCEEEIIRTDELIDKLYRQAGVQRPIKLFRFPYGNKGVNTGFFDTSYSESDRERIEAIQKILIQNGYGTYPFDNINFEYFKRMQATGQVDWLWTYDAMEWCVFQEDSPFGVRTIEDVLEMMDLDLPERWMGLNDPSSNEIIVIHDHPQTTDMFEPIIKAFLDKGIHFKRIVES